MKILEFVFSDWLHFLGTLVLLTTVFGGIRSVIQAIVNRSDSDDTTE